MSKKKYTSAKEMDDYQAEALKEAYRRNRYGIFFQQRVGKTRVAIDFCGAKFTHDNWHKVMICTTLSARMGWMEQLEEYLPEDIPRELTLCPKEPTKRKEYYKNHKGTRGKELEILVMNYDILKNDADFIIKWAPDIIIWDEAHVLCGYGSSRSKAAARIAKHAKGVLPLTGTPIPKKPADVYGLFRAFKPEVFGTTWTGFKNEYCIMGGFEGREIIGYRGLDDLKRKVTENSIRVLRKDVHEAEPEIENIIYPVMLEPKALQMYRELRDEFVVECEAGLAIADLPGVRVMRLQQLCGGFLHVDGNMERVSVAKVNAAVDLVTTHTDGGEKVVVFARFLAEIHALKYELENRKVKVATYYGETPEKERNNIIKAFQESDLEVIVMQIGTGTMGITLDASHVNVFFSLDYRLANMQQARDRVMGRGQTAETVTNYFVAVKGTVDYKIMKTLSKDEELSDVVSNEGKFMRDEDD